MNHPHKTLFSLRLALGGLLGSLCLSTMASCASAPPKELLDARAAYKSSSMGLAAKENPAQLHTAESSLQLAESAFDADGDSEHTRDLSYIAMRKAQLAEVQARTMLNDKRLSEAEAMQTQSRARELTQLRGQYADQQQKLGASEQARADAEQRAASAARDLARIATVKQEPRGMVITLSGGVLFASNKSTLLPSAQAKLTEVANALTQQSPDATIVVEGHTDAQGSQTLNLDLSTRRAQTVRDYLTSHGVAADRIRAEGLGFSRPLADNKTAEGRANNRRVEIVVNGPQS